MRVLGHVTLWVPCPQVPFFLFVVFAVYALLPLSTRAAIVVGVSSTVSHLLVFGAVTRALETSMSSTQLGLQVRVMEAGREQALAWDRACRQGPVRSVLTVGLGYSVDSGPSCCSGPCCGEILP